ncbi:hypothetical protein D9M68_541390 [compost metagenome]
MGATPDILHDAVHLLRAVGHANGEDQERHEDREGIEVITEQRHQPQLPGHCDHRTEDHQRGAAHAAGVEVDDGGGDQRGGAEIHHHLYQAVEQVADQLGETDDADLDRPRALLARHPRRAVEFVLVAQLLFQGAGERVVVHGLAGDRVLLQQRHEDHARLEVVAHQAADDAGAGDVHPQLLHALRRTIVGVRHDRAATEAFLGHFGPAHGRGPQRLHPGAVHARRDEQLVVDLLEHLQIARVEDIAAAILHHDPHRVAQPPQGLAVIQVVLDERMTLRKHFFEAGAEGQARGGVVAQRQGGEQARQHYQ